MTQDNSTIICNFVTDSPPITLELSDDNIQIDFTQLPSPTVPVEDVRYLGVSVVNGNHIANIPIQPITDVLTPAQLSAINSGITSVKVTAYDLYATSKQDKIDSSHKLSYSLISDTPSIPTKTSDITNDSGYITNSVGNLLYYTLTSELGSLAFKSNVDYLTDIINRPTIPTKTSDITNDSGFITKDVNNLTYYMLSSDINSNYLSKSVAQNATSSDKLTTVSFVNSSISSETAYFRGTFNYLKRSSLSEDYGLLDAPWQESNPSGTYYVSNNDYCFVKSIDTYGNTLYNRYKWNSTSSHEISGVTTKWWFEYALNNSSFTQVQWDAINSGITNLKVNIYDAYAGQIASKQNTLSQTQMNAVDSGITSSKVSTYDGYATGKQNTIDSTHKLDYSLISNTPSIPSRVSDLANDIGYITRTVNDLSYYTLSSDLATVATSGSYNDLTNKPTIPTIPDIVIDGGGSETGKAITSLTVDANNKHKINVTKGTFLTQHQSLANYVTLDTEQTISAKKSILVTEPIVQGGQETLLNVLSTRSTADIGNTAMWTGRMKVGNKNKSFIIGVYRGNLGADTSPICGLGAHSWTDSSAETGASWEDVYIQPDGDKACYIGGKDWRHNSGWLKVQNSNNVSGGKVYYNKGSTIYPSWKEVAVTDVATTSTNGLMSSTDKTNVNANTSARHTHTNKSTLDNIEGTATATTLGIDTVVTSGSNNLITSGAVYTVIGNIEATLQAIRGV